MIGRNFFRIVDGYFSINNKQGCVELRRKNEISFGAFV